MVVPFGLKASVPVTVTSLANVPLSVPLPICSVAPDAMVSAPELLSAPVRMSVPAVKLTAPPPVTVPA